MNGSSTEAAQCVKLVPLALGGEPLPARPGVLCASCNARKGLSQRRR